MLNGLEQLKALKKGHKIIKESEHGFMAVMSDSTYREIKADCKSDLSHVLATKRDYQFHVLENHPKKKTKSLEDGSLLHTLAIERSVFESRYFVLPDFDEMHKGNPLYFGTKSQVGEFIKDHNNAFEYLNQLVDTEATIINERESVEVFSKLPNSVQAAQPKNKAESSKAVKAFLKQIVKIDINSVELETNINQAIKQIEKMGGGIDKELPADPKSKAVIVSDILATTVEQFGELSHNEQVSRLLDAGDCVSDAAKKKALKAYNDSNKIDLRSALTDKIQKLEALSIQLPEKVTNAKPHQLMRITPMSAKVSVDDALTEIQSLYDKQCFYKPHLEDAVNEEAGTRIKVAQKIYDHAERIIEYLYQHPQTSSVFKKQMLVEVALVWIDPLTGRLQKAKLDLADIDSHTIYDLKFQVDSSDKKLNQAFGEYKYHLQNAHYANGYKIVMDVYPNFDYLVVQKDAPLGDTEISKPVRVTSAKYGREENKDIIRANELLDMARDLVQTAESENHYPCHTESLQLEVPRYQVTLEEEMLRVWRESKANSKKDSDNASDEDLEKAFGAFIPTEQLFSEV
ncbi:PD-(D/E)XK nuclease-like domain-containing protein [Photobacterium leiognathi]|uniref:PD-(D/E)XK nuclease-like domain-containing protein n=1 Tax=Photobacterium leiognathi TaxID=553611 RepID=UPI0029819141|nr:PD-(D/E)XK nuclease-like domain-containing protein [Photobacterium leiognathi]